MAWSEKARQAAAEARRKGSKASRQAYTAGILAGRKSVRNWDFAISAMTRRKPRPGSKAEGYFTVGYLVGKKHAKLLRIKDFGEATKVRKSTHRK